MTKSIELFIPKPLLDVVFITLYIKPIGTFHISNKFAGSTCGTFAIALYMHSMIGYGSGYVALLGGSDSLGKSGAISCNK